MSIFHHNQSPNLCTLYQIKPIVYKLYVHRLCISKVKTTLHHNDAKTFPNKRKEKEIMDIRKSKVVCILLLNMLDAELSRVIDYALEDDNENTNHALVTSLIQVLDDVDIAIEELYKDVV